VIGLPANIFYGTGIPTSILVFKKQRKDADNILFIDASKGFDKIKAQNYLADEHVNKIVDTYTKREEIEKFSHLASMEEIIENEYNLNIPRYVDTFEEEEDVDLDEVSENLKELAGEIESIDKEINKYCDELGIKSV